MSNSSFSFENIQLKKVEIDNDKVYLISDVTQLKLDDITDIRNIKIRTSSIEKNNTASLVINKKMIIDTLHTHDNYSQIENIFREFKYENGFDNEISFEDSFLELLESEKRNDTNKRPRTFLLNAAMYMKVAD